VVDLSERELAIYFSLWMKWKATDGKFTIAQLLEEPEEPWDAVHEIEGRYQSLLNVLRKNASSNS